MVKQVEGNSTTFRLTPLSPHACPLTLSDPSCSAHHLLCRPAIGCLDLSVPLPSRTPNINEEIFLKSLILFASPCWYSSSFQSSQFGGVHLIRMKIRFKPELHLPHCTSPHIHSLNTCNSRFPVQKWISYTQIHRSSSSSFLLHPSLSPIH